MLTNSRGTILRAACSCGFHKCDLVVGGRSRSFSPRGSYAEREDTRFARLVGDPSWPPARYLAAGSRGVQRMPGYCRQCEDIVNVDIAVASEVGDSGANSYRRPTCQGDSVVLYAQRFKSTARANCVLSIREVAAVFRDWAIVKGTIARNARGKICAFHRNTNFCSRCPWRHPRRTSNAAGGSSRVSKPPLRLALE